MHGAGRWVQRAAFGVIRAVVAVACWTVVGAQGTSRDAPLPVSEGVDIVQARCVSCHGSDLIASQRLSEAGWGREVDKMVRWGATVPDADRPGLVAYLARHFGVAPVASHPPDDGAALFARACLQCHGADLTEQQRLSPIGWTREVEKMMRWGAQLTETEKPALVAFLVARYPAR